MADNVEHGLGTVQGSKKNFQGYVTKSGLYCFLRLSANNVDHRFFFKCSAKALNEAYFRTLNAECPYPPTTPPTPPTEEVCYLYAKRAAENIQNTVLSIGQENAAGVYNCYISVILKVTPGNLESMCTREAVSSEWQAITAEDLKEAAKKNVSEYTDE